MSRARRRLSQIGKRESVAFIRERKLDKDELVQILCHRHKRNLIGRGIIQDPKTRAARYKFTWNYDGLSGVVYADDRSTARSIIKVALGVKKKRRLPPEVDITRELNVEEGNDDDEDSTGIVGSNNERDDKRTKTCIPV